MSDVPTPTISGPVPVTPTSYPFFASELDLASHGYVEEEYFVGGQGFRYSTGGLTTGTKNLTGGPNGDGAFPYKTRIVVRRPIDSADFNGTTVLEWYNVTGGFDAEWNWFNDPSYYMRHGYAWVGVSAQNAGVNRLRTWNPSRYGAGGGDLNVNPTGAGTDALSYDVFASVAKALRGGHNGPDPMDGLQTDTIVASGESQSGSRLATYYNNVQPIHEVIDSFLITVSGGALRSDRPENKAIRILSDNEIGSPSTEADTASYRRWEVPGGSHLPFMAYRNFAAVGARDAGATVVNCSRRPLSRVPWPLVYNRALDAIVKWHKGTEVPPTAPRATYNGTTLARDEHGNALGGIRLPEAEVPTARNDGINSIGFPLNQFSLFCGLLGSWTQFSPDKLHNLYQDYGDYRDRFDAKAEDVVAAGFVNADDLPSLKETAARYTRLRPTRPSYIGDSGTPNRGAFDIGWRGPEPDATATTYEVQSRDSAAESDWAGVPGAGALDARAFSAGDFPEGTHSVRVRSTSIIPPLHPDPELIETTPFSEALAGIVVDKTAPNAPSATPDRDPDYAGNGGWYRDQVTVSFAANGDPDLADGSPGSGADPSTLTAPKTRSASGSYALSGTVKDRAGNESQEGTANVNVDATDPTLELSCPAEVILNQLGVAASFSAADGQSGLASAADGNPVVDTSSVGLKTTSVTATDNVGRTRTKSCTTRVVYAFGGFSSPISPTGANSFKLGQAVPVKFELRDFGGVAVSTAIASLEIAPVSGNNVGTYVRAPSTMLDGDGLFSFSEDQYVFILATKPLAKGVWSLRATLNDGKSYTVRITLK